MGADPVPARNRWAVDLLAARPDEQLLEVGCGPGVAAALVCEQLTSGRLLAVDRSPTAAERTRRRNAAHLALGRLEVCTGALADLALPPGAFDAAFSVDVNAFWTGAAMQELEVLRAELRPGGRLLVLYGANGPTGADRVQASVAEALRRHGFVDVLPVSGDGGFGVVGRRAQPTGAEGGSG